MNQRQESEQRARAGRVYVWLLHLYPAAYRRAFGPPMLQTFRDHYQDAIQTKEESELRFWLGVLGDEGKSIAREHLAALKERKATMKKLPLIGLAVGGVLLIGLMQLFPRSSGSGFSLLLPVLVIFALLAALALFAAWLVFIRKTSLKEWPPIALAVGGVALLLVLGWLNVGFQGMLSFAALSMAFLLLFGSIIAGLLAIIARFVRTLPQPAVQPGWVRVGLVLGGMIAFYEVVSDVLRVLLTSSEVGRLLGGIVPLLLIGVVGVIGGYASGRTRTGAYAGLLTGFMGLGGDEPYRHVPYFFSDQFDYSINMLGYPSSSAEIVIRGELSANAFTAFYLEGGILRAAFMLNDDAHLELLRQWIATARRISDAQRLADPSVPPAALTPV